MTSLTVHGSPGGESFEKVQGHFHDIVIWT